MHQLNNNLLVSLEPYVLQTQFYKLKKEALAIC